MTDSARFDRRIDFDRKVVATVRVKAEPIALEMIIAVT